VRYGLCPVDVNGYDKAFPAKAAVIRLRQLVNRAAKNLEAGLELPGLAASSSFLAAVPLAIASTSGIASATSGGTARSLPMVSLAIFL
jgi:hypothetical protein